MPANKAFDYESVTPMEQGKKSRGETLFSTPSAGKDSRGAVCDEGGPSNVAELARSRIRPSRRSIDQSASRAHAFTFAVLFLFTAVLYFRPYEFLALPTNLAFWLALLTLAIYLPSQLSAAGNLTDRPREVNLVLLLCLLALLSIPLAKGSTLVAWQTFTNVFIRAVLIFIVIVNVTRTRARLKALLLLSLAAGCFLAVGALRSYRLGQFTVEGYRIEGVIGGMFENPNDMAIYLVIMVPIATVFFFASRGLVMRIVYGVCAVLLVAATVVTFSRAGFLAMLAVGLTLAWTLGRKHRTAVILLSLLVIAGFLALAPGNYASRILSIFNHDLDGFGSAEARQVILLRSIRVALRNPLFGIGMGNFEFVSVRNLETHNAYTQVAAEMGIAAMVVYTLFVVTPLRRLRAIVRDTFASRRSEQIHYLAVGLQASLVGYMVASFFASVAYYWHVYYLVGYAVCLCRIYDAGLARDTQRGTGVTLAESATSPSQICDSAPAAFYGGIESNHRSRSGTDKASEWVRF